jgi:hypothetical protein
MMLRHAGVDIAKNLMKDKKQLPPPKPKKEGCVSSKLLLIIQHRPPT